MKRPPIPREEETTPVEGALRRRDREPSVHDIAEQMRDLEERFDEITGSHYVQVPAEVKRPTSTPPEMQWVQRRIGAGVLKAIGVAALTVLTVVVTSAVKDCQASAERHIIERSK